VLSLFSSIPGDPSVCWQCSTRITNVATKVAVEHVEPVLVLAPRDAVTGLKDRVRRFSSRRNVSRHYAKVHIGQGISSAGPQPSLTSFLDISQSQADT
jgi:hypothetical protein